MINLKAQAELDSKNILESYEFSSPATIQAPDGSTGSIRGLSNSPNAEQEINGETILTQSPSFSCSIDSVFSIFGKMPESNKGWFIKMLNSNNIEKTYAIRKVLDDNAHGIITMILENSKHEL